jgi:hypothetical protein
MIVFLLALVGHPYWRFKGSDSALETIIPTTPPDGLGIDLRRCLDDVSHAMRVFSA